MMTTTWIFAACGLATMGFLCLSWQRYWAWTRRFARITNSLRRRPDTFPLANGADLEYQEDDCEDKQNTWYTRYHWCLVLGPLFFAGAVFFLVHHALSDHIMWIIRFLLSLMGGGAIGVIGWILGYGPVREYLLPLEETLSKQE